MQGPGALQGADFPFLPSELGGIDVLKVMWRHEGIKKELGAERGRDSFATQFCSRH